MALVDLGRPAWPQLLPSEIFVENNWINEGGLGGRPPFHKKTSSLILDAQRDLLLLSLERQRTHQPA